MKRLFAVVATMFVVVALAAAGTIAAGRWWLEQPLPLARDAIEVTIEAGATPRDAAYAWVHAGVATSPWLLHQWFRWSGEARKIRAGTYGVERGVTARGLLDKMVRGEQLMFSVRLIEGWTLRQFRQELARTATLKQASAKLSDEQLMAALGAAGTPPEGRFFPDTYSFVKGASDLLVLKRAYEAMQQRLEASWTERAADSPLKSPHEALVLASIVEKETGAAAERGLVAGVFANRLRIGMPLQTDPSVIYGMGERFDGNLRKRDLQTDTPYNTYTRSGLPPTPIAMPGLASLRAAVNPQATKALYFVSRGDGSSEFSDNLSAHNRAVDKYQRGK